MSSSAKLIVVGFLIGFSCYASAAPGTVKVTLGGSLDTQVGYQLQKGVFKTNTPPSPDMPAFKLDSYGLVNDTKLRIKADGRRRSFRYGGLVVLNDDTSISKEGETSVAYQTMIYTESSLGRLEAGSYGGAYEFMKVSGSSIARATGGIDGDWNYWVNTNIDGEAAALVSPAVDILIYRPRLPTSFDRAYEANASKITYYAPATGLFRFGITYIPDTDQHGTVTNLKGLSKYIVVSSAYNQTVGYTDVFQGGVSYKARCKDIRLQFSALGEAGKAKKLVVFGPNQVLENRYNLKAYEVGGGFSYKDFTFAASYGSWGKSGLAKTVQMPISAGTVYSVKNSKPSSYWTIGASYIQRCYGMSFGYFSSESGGFGPNLNSADPAYSGLKGKVQLYSFGVDYRIIHGFMPYAEVTLFNLTDKANPTSGKNDGKVLLVGSKFEF